MVNKEMEKQVKSTSPFSDNQFRISINQIDMLIAKISDALNAPSELEGAGNIRVTYEPLAVYLARNGVKYG